MYRSLGIETFMLRSYMQMFIAQSLALSESLKWFDSLIDQKTEITHSPPLIVIDHGGTTVRLALISFQNTHPYFHEPIISLAARNHHENPVEFINWLIHSIPTNWVHQSHHIAWILSYPHQIVRSSNDISAHITHTTKNLSVPDLVGQNLASLFRTQASLKNFDINKITILNDTIATLLTVPQAQQALVVGTGGNIASRHPHLPNIRNVEAGNFNAIPHTQGSASISLPHQQSLEKQTTGKYIPENLLNLLKSYLSENENLIFQSKNSIAPSSFISDIAKGNWQEEQITPGHLFLAQQYARVLLQDSAKLWGMAVAACFRLNQMPAPHLAVTGSLALKTPGYLDLLRDTFFQLTATPLTITPVSDILPGAARAVMM